MKGIRKIEYTAMALLMKTAREEKGIAMENAWRAIGFSSREHLYKSESGRIGWSLLKLKRACQLYGISASDAIEAAIEDFRNSLKGALK